MDTILQFLTGVLRYVLPVLALLILAVCSSATTKK